MRDDKITDRGKAEAVPHPAFQHTGAAAEPGGSEGMAHESRLEFIRSIYGLVKPLAERAQMPDMVKMVMGDQHCGERVHGQGIFLKSLLEFPQADSGIYQKSVFSSTEIIAVAAAPA